MQHHSTTISTTPFCPCPKCTARRDSQPAGNIWTRYPIPRKDRWLVMRSSMNPSQSAQSQRLSSKIPPAHISTAVICTTSPLTGKAPWPVASSDPSSSTKTACNMDLDEIALTHDLELAYPQEPFVGSAPFHEAVPPRQKSQAPHPPPNIPPIPDLPPQIPQSEIYPPIENSFQLKQPVIRSPWNSLPLEPVGLQSTVSFSRPNRIIRTCITKKCTGLIVPSSTCSRCVNCIMADWRTRKAKGFSLPKSLRAPPTSILRTNASRKSKRKSVSWADQRLEGDQSSRNGFGDGVSRVKRVRLKVPDPLPPPSEVDDAGVKKPSTQVEDIGSRVSSPEEIPSPKAGDESNEVPAVTGQTPTIAYETCAKSFLDDSDLSDLTDLSSSESDVSEKDESGESETSDRSLISPNEQTAAPIKLTIRIPARSPTVSSVHSFPSLHRNHSVKVAEMPFAQCSTTSCGRYLPLTHEGSLCIWCRLAQKSQLEQTTGQEYQQHVPSTPITISPLPKNNSFLTNLVNQELLSRDVVTGARICTSCQHIIPPYSEYPYNTCYPCQPQPKQQSIANVLAETSPDEEMEGTILTTPPDPQTGRCQNRDCGVIIHGYSECWQCTTRRMGVRGKQDTKRRKPGTAITTGESGEMKNSQEPSTCSKQQYSQSPHLFTPYPEYRCQHELLADFHMKILGFVEVQNIRSLYKPHRNPETSVFGFDGQFSVVALDSDLVDRQGAIGMSVVSLKGELERLGALQFNPEKYVTINESGIFTRFLCIHRIYDPFGPPYPDQDPQVMQGELEIAILSDQSHPFLPGEKTVIRFRLVG